MQEILEPDHPCHACGHWISTEQSHPHPERESEKYKNTEKWASKSRFEYAPVHDRRRSSEHDEHGQKTGSKRNSLINFIRRLSTPFIEELRLDEAELEQRRQSRAEKLESSVQKYCRFAKYE